LDVFWDAMYIGLYMIRDVSKSGRTLTGICGHRGKLCWSVKYWSEDVRPKFTSTTSTTIRPGDICHGTTKSLVDFWSLNRRIHCRRSHSTSAHCSCSATYSWIFYNLIPVHLCMYSTSICTRIP